MNFKDIPFPETYKYRSDSERKPLEFFQSAFPLSKQVDMILGYFSTNAIKVLSKGFAEFIYKGGAIRIITNHELSFNDKKNLLIDTKVEDANKMIDIFSNFDDLKKELSREGQHFFDCLKYLLEKGKLKIQPVMHIKKEGDTGSLAHYKDMIFNDGENKLYASGSANFTQAGIIINGEKIGIETSWGSEKETKSIIDIQRTIDSIFKDEHPHYKLLKAEEVEGIIRKVGNGKDREELLEDAVSFTENINYLPEVKEFFDTIEKEITENINLINSSPKFPEENPYPYQILAYKAWERNEYKGLFAMATGTGKTLTSIYCLVEEFKKNKIQKNIIIVPGEELIRQWAKDFEKANFSNIFLWYSKNKRLNKEIEDIKILKDGDSLNIIITYDSFQLPKFQSIFKNILKNYTVIFDEAHNIGAQKFKSTIENIEFSKLIGLSATPLRLWDEGNTNQFIEDLFNAPPPYTFSFSMEEAIEKKFLCPYKYIPSFAELTEAEFDEYLFWTKKIFIPKDGSMTGNAATQRQLVLDTAENKEGCLIRIIQDLIDSDQYKYTLVYCPKGKNRDDARIIKNYAENAANKFKSKQLNIQFFLGETDDRSYLLEDFESGNVDMLFAIKCLDEGVNIPITQNAIFVASGKNYREFIQRRGRVLRNYNKNGHKKEYANIYDIVVLPTSEQYKKNTNICTKLIIAEFRRLVEFYKMSIPNINTTKFIDEKLKKFDLTYYYILELISRENEQREAS